MKFRLILLHFLSLLTIVLLIFTANSCKDYIGYESLGDVGLILVLSPIYLFVIGTLRLIFSINIGLKLIYRLQEYIYALPIFMLLFLISDIDSMLWGFIFSIIFSFSTLAMSFFQNSTYLRTD
ncbi:hypothetical protein DWB61_17800 [Ancylomarina euxinus]|uniref:Uncharacterized protein n=1 Tax=Ancylomarina euxinus TaxID=2283627 RepID=A0A425XWA4_9BACT|nr:hypothetical protein DWB61_17800 [Ancylomarina euxinus]